MCGRSTLFAILLFSFTPTFGSHSAEIPAKLYGPVAHLYALSTQGHSALSKFRRSSSLPLEESGGAFVVTVLCEPVEGKTAHEIDREPITSAGGTVTGTSKSYVRVEIPVEKLSTLSTHSQISRIHAPLLPEPASYGTGGNVSEAVELTGAAGYQRAGYDGSGIDIAVVDFGFMGLTEAMDSAEILAIEKFDFTDSGLQTQSKHGTGIAEVVADLAPGATLHCLKIGDLLDLENAAEYCGKNGIRLANASLSFTGYSYYDGTGPVSDVINDSREKDGVFWTVAAGNKAETHWRGSWTDTDRDYRLDFTNTPNRMKLQNPGRDLSIVLNWDQYSTRASFMTDFDLFVYDENDSLVASSEMRQWMTAYPLESVSWENEVKDATYYLEIKVVSYWRNPEGLDMTFFVKNVQLDEIVMGSSMADPASASGAFTVGAVEAAVWDTDTVAIRNYSSHGPTTDGRMKPEIAAPDGMANWSYGTISGTSASSPVVAGLAAILLQEDNSLSADNLADKFVSSAIDFGPVGLDSLAGAGKVRLITATEASPPRIRVPALSQYGESRTQRYDLRGATVPNPTPNALPAGVYVRKAKDSRKRLKRELNVGQRP